MLSTGDLVQLLFPQILFRAEESTKASYDPAAPNALKKEGFSADGSCIFPLVQLEFTERVTASFCKELIALRVIVDVPAAVFEHLRPSAQNKKSNHKSCHQDENFPRMSTSYD